MMARWIAIALVALATAGTAFAGQGQPQPQAQDKGKGKEQSQSQGKDSSNHGQVVSNCNHQANERKLQGQDRKHFVEWCTERGERYGYDQQRYNYDRNCYQSADGKGLTDSLRKAFLGDCLGQRDRDYDSDRKRAQDRDGDSSVPGRDVLNKSGEKKN
jgi:hypothetical protein